MASWGQQQQQAPAGQQRPYGTKPAWLVTKEKQQQQQQAAAPPPQQTPAARGGPPPLPHDGGWTSGRPSGGGSGGSGWDVGPAQSHGSSAPGAGFGGAPRPRYSGGGGRHSSGGGGGGGGGGDWPRRQSQPPPPAAQPQPRHHRQQQQQQQQQHPQGPRRPGFHPAPQQQPGRPADPAHATAGWGGDRRANVAHEGGERWRADPMVGRSTSRARKGADEDAMRAIVGDLSQAGQEEVLGAVESLRKDGSFDKLVQKVQVAMERGGDLDRLRSLTQQEAATELRHATRRGLSEQDLKFKTLMKQIRDQVENRSKVPEELNEAVNKVLGSATFGELLSAEMSRQEEEAVAAKEEAELAAHADEDEDEDESDDTSSEEDDDDDDDDEEEEEEDEEDDDDDSGGARVRGAGTSVAAAAGGEDEEDSGSSSDEEGGARVRGSGTSTAAATAESGARVRGAGVAAAPAAAPAPDAAAAAGGELTAGQVIEVFDELEDEWQRATVVSATGKSPAAEYLVRYDGQSATTKELLLPGTFRLVDSPPSTAMDVEAPAATKLQQSDPEPASSPSVESEKAPLKRRAPDGDDTAEEEEEEEEEEEAAEPAPKRPAKGTDSPVKDAHSNQEEVGHDTKPTGGDDAAASQPGQEQTAADGDTSADAAPADAAPAAAEDEDDEEWLTAGSDWLGKRVVRVFDGVRFIGQVISWVPANDDGDPPLWKIKHDDGDEEDLEECVIHPAPSRPVPCHVMPCRAKPNCASA